LFLLLPQFAFHQDARQYLSEFLLLEYFISSPCRVLGDPKPASLRDPKPASLADSTYPLIPIYHIICFPFKYVLSMFKSFTPAMIRDLEQVLNDVLLRYVHRVRTYVLLTFGASCLSRATTAFLSLLIVRTAVIPSDTTESIMC